MFLLVILVLNHRWRGVPFRQRPTLHQVIIGGLSWWFIYIAFDTILYVIAPISFSEPPIGVQLSGVGYDPDYPSLFIANIMRDIGFTGALLLGWAYLFASILISAGEEKFRKKISRNPIILAIIIISTIIFVANDVISVTVSSTNVNVTAGFNGVAGSSILSTIFIYFLGGGLLIRALNRSFRTQSQEIRNQLRFITLGIIFMGLGHSYWFTLGLLVPIIPHIIFAVKPIEILYYIGHSFWTCAAIFIYLGFRKDRNAWNLPDIVPNVSNQPAEKN
jgi:hypothetical protein